MLSSLPSDPPKEPVKIDAPHVRPKRKLIRKPVFLSQETWAALDECAEFEGEVFKAAKADQKVSRNDVIAAFLDWAIRMYWEGHNGKPESAVDRAAKVKRGVERIKQSEKPEN